MLSGLRVEDEFGFFWCFRSLKVASMLLNPGGGELRASNIRAFTVREGLLRKFASTFYGDGHYEQRFSFKRLVLVWCNLYLEVQRTWSVGL